MALKQVKNKIISTQKTGKVTKAMEAVSAVKMRKSQQRALQGKPFAESAVRILQRISKSRAGKQLFAHEHGRAGATCIIVITSDKGLAGNLNSAVIKEVDYVLADKELDDVRLITFGRKATEYYARRGYTIDEQYTNISDDVALGDMRTIAESVSQGFANDAYKTVSVAYQSFVSTFEQNAVLRDVLPLDPTALEVMVRDIVPKSGAYSDIGRELNEHTYTVEPDIETVMTLLVPQLVQIMIYHALLESKAAEHSARMVAMKNATDKAKEVTKALTLEYNKERQAEITAEVSEITGGIEAMRT